MKKIGLLAALVMATATPAMAMTSGLNHQGVGPTAVSAASTSGASAAPEQCVRRLDRFGNVRVICSNLREARLAWGARRPTRGNFVVFYHDGRNFRVWRSWSPPRRPR